eukprot:Transcript_28540.p1 GENE.Transcript_28540~~Transcript_28540.p1  ORF type:complete len:604 (-),score=289.02 Transcript_28540:152-1885(-)
MPSSGAKKTIKTVLKQHKKGCALDELKRAVLEQLTAEGMSAKKAGKTFDAKIQLPCFAVQAGVVRLVKSKESGATAAPAAPPKAEAKRKQPPAAEAPPPAKKDKKAAAAAKPAAMSVRMMGASEAAAYRKEHVIEVSGTNAESFRPLAGFADAGFSGDVLRSTATFAQPTPIQAQCWPPILAGRDTIGVAETGSGKTLAFFLPALETVFLRTPAKKNAPETQKVRVLILAPTRELAMQTEEVCRAAGAVCGVGSVCIYGGVPKGPQKQALREGARVVVATPGRLLDLAQEGALSLGGVDYLVLDEADRMLDMGFEKDVRAIISQTPAARRTVMFTATWPESIRALAEEFLRDPVRVSIGSQELTANHRVTQHVEVVEQHHKEARLPQLLTKYAKELQGAGKVKGADHRVIIFALYKKEAARVEQTLQRQGHRALAIHGDMTQEQRTRALGAFKEGSTPLLVATDVAARGLDIPDVELVINYTFPLTIEDYIHRIGRTGRGGKTGVSHTLFTTADKAHAGALQNVLREASQEVPEALLRFGSAVKKKEHKVYGAFGPKEGMEGKTATKIVFANSDDED